MDTHLWLRPADTLTRTGLPTTQQQQQQQQLVLWRPSHKHNGNATTCTAANNRLAQDACHVINAVTPPSVSDRFSPSLVTHDTPTHRRCLVAWSAAAAKRACHYQS